MINLVIKFSYKDLLTSVNFHVAGTAIAYGRLSFRTTCAAGMALLNVVLLQVFQNKTKISLPVLPVSLAEYLQILKKVWFICNDEHIIDNNTFNMGGIVQPEIDLE